MWGPKTGPSSGQVETGGSLKLAGQPESCRFCGVLVSRTKAEKTEESVSSPSLTEVLIVIKANVYQLYLP